ncbi:hypothetical protein pb186bvf_017131 [Paramecium bursaria]
MLNRQVINKYKFYEIYNFMELINNNSQDKKNKIICRSQFKKYLNI